MAAKEKLLSALKTNYEVMKANGDVASPAAYERAIDPQLLGFRPEERRELGKALWDEFYAWHEETADTKPYPFTGLAVYLDPPVGGC